MSKFKFVLILVSITNQAIKATTQENVMKKFLSLLSPATPTFTAEETIEWNRLVSEAVKAQYESFSDDENLDWDLMVDEVRFHQVGIPSTLAQAYAEMGMESNDHCHRCEPPIETCTVCNNDKFVGAKVDSPFICGGCQEETRYHLSLMKTEKEWEEKKKEEFLNELPF